MSTFRIACGEAAIERFPEVAQLLLVAGDDSRVQGDGLDRLLGLLQRVARAPRMAGSPIPLAMPSTSRSISRFNPSMRFCSVLCCLTDLAASDLRSS
jgi:hypothetical protein